jgi:hypothetical protein
VRQRRAEKADATRKGIVALGATASKTRQAAPGYLIETLARLGEWGMKSPIFVEACLLNLYFW